MHLVTYTHIWVYGLNTAAPWEAFMLYPTCHFPAATPLDFLGYPKCFQTCVPKTLKWSHRNVNGTDVWVLYVKY